MRVGHGEPAPELELKLLVEAARVDSVAARLCALCTADPRYPRNTVYTLYFDTPELDLLADKRNSQYRKVKVRARWYVCPDTGEESAAFAEVKHRRGGHRHKLRRPMQHPGRTLLSPGRAGREAVAELLGLCGLGARPSLKPALLVTYERFRFVEPFSAARVCLDRSIRLAWANPETLPQATAPRSLSVGIVEVKGSLTALPSSLRDLRAWGCRQRSFSKYAEVASRAGV